MEKMTKLTKDFYNKNCKEYIESTVCADMSFQYGMFEEYLKKDDKVLEIGFGSGRDFEYFAKKYDVYGIDITEGFVENLKFKGYQNVFLADVQDFCFNTKFNGIWACASLLHIKKENLKDVFKNCCLHLKTGGVFYFSFKLGNFCGERNGRYFVDMDKTLLNELIKGLDFEVKKIEYTLDVRKDRDDKWINVILIKL
ncbi:MAG: class I SAM-dependent methyltransferase [Clostridia bacterium]|nr:class I SAM-dependent methyltransferase [Clostridia bacterium]